MDTHRNRSSGWKYAKLSGHSNEELVCRMLKEDKEQQLRLLRSLGRPNSTITNCSYGGLRETHVPSILGGVTKSKADITVEFSNGETVGISVKKSLAGQVFLIRDKNFIKGFELQYDKFIPSNIKRAISLFWGSADDTISIINSYSSNPSTKQYEIYKHRLTAETLRQYDESLYIELLNWFKENIYYITDYCFSRGQAKDIREKADIIWYINLLGEHDIDEMYHINSLCREAESNKDLIQYGTRGGGTTITLPFGFVQWHQTQIQFHHQYKQIKSFNI